MKKILCIAVLAAMFSWGNCQNVSAQDSLQKKDCDFRINGLCAAQDIGGVDVEILYAEDSVTYAVFTNYNNFPVTVLYVIKNSAPQNHSYKVAVGETYFSFFNTGFCNCCYTGKCFHMPLNAMGVSVLGVEGVKKLKLDKSYSQEYEKEYRWQYNTSFDTSKDSVLSIMDNSSYYSINGIIVRKLQDSNSVNKVSNDECTYTINGICSTEDIGGVDVECSPETIVFTNYNNYPVTVLYEIDNKEKKGAIVLGVEGVKKIKSSRQLPILNGIIVRKLASN